MKLELKENMYVRTKDGIIAKVDYIDDDTIFFDKDLYRTYSDSIDFLEKDNLERIAKASYDKTDILEVGDYVNGSKVIKIENVENYPDLSSIKIEKSDFRYGVYETVFEKDIKSIVTHEQMEQISYKIGDDKE